MRSGLLIAGLMVLVTLSGCIGDSTGTDSAADGALVDANRDGQVVVAVIDSGFNPYHWDLLADHMPQHLDDDASNDVPLDQDPAEWLAGHPGAGAFSSYQRMNLTLSPDDPEAEPNCRYEPNTVVVVALSSSIVCDDAPDQESWDNVQTSNLAEGEIHMNWIPGTKVVGMVNFASNPYQASSHGVGTSSVSVGNIHGSCPNCLLVFVNGNGEQANRWVESQDWIDVQTNSWGYSAGVAVRDRFYAGSDVMAQKAAVERGQAIFFSAGNGLGNTFTVPNPTLFSSQEGPDWIITVGAVSPGDKSSYTGHGKPADVAAIGSGYPSAGGDNVTAESSFGGTSNSTPVTAGLYAQALWHIRNGGGSRTQDANVISVGGSCGSANPDCALADGELTYAELRESLYAAAEHTHAGHAVGLVGRSTVPDATSEELDLMAQGHGSFIAKLEGGDEGDAVWQEEVQRIVDIATGRIAMPEPDADLAAWRNALSFCTQVLWGEWDLGHKDEAALPDADPNWPVRSWMVDECPTQGPAIIAANQLVTDAHPFY